jgi:hypothetical protein
VYIRGVLGVSWRVEGLISQPFKIMDVREIASRPGLSAIKPQANVKLTNGVSMAK